MRRLGGPTLIADIYGMNFQSIPALHLRFVYRICLAVSAVEPAVKTIGKPKNHFDVLHTTDAPGIFVTK